MTAERGVVVMSLERVLLLGRLESEKELLSLGDLGER